MIHDNSDALRRCENIIQRSQYTFQIKDQLWELIRNKDTTLAWKCMLMGGNHQEQRTLTKALQELLTLTDDPFLGKQI